MKLRFTLALLSVAVLIRNDSQTRQRLRLDVRNHLTVITDIGLSPYPSGRLGRNAALNILAAGHAVTVSGVGKAQAPTMKQKPAYGTAR